jgi:hypothetical protein
MIRELSAFRGGRLLVALRDWAADQAERESWNDGDRAVHHYCRMVLLGAIAEIEELKGGER